MRMACLPEFSILRAYMEKGIARLSTVKFLFPDRQQAGVIPKCYLTLPTQCAFFTSAPALRVLRGVFSVLEYRVIIP